MSNNIILKVENVNKIINRKTIISNVSFNIEEGEIVALIGNNGSGKTSIMKLIVGLFKLTSGNIYVNGLNISKERKKMLNYVGAIIEIPALYENLTGLQNINYFWRFYKNIPRSRIKEIIDLFEMEEFINSKVRDYSLGMKQRLGIAISILHNPKLLILDEPINGIDPKGVFLLRKYLKKISKELNISILISSHILSEIENICDRALVIKDGKIQSDILITNNISLQALLNEN